MKKLLVLLLTIIISINICACSKEKGDKITSNTCSINENSMEKTFKLTATNDEIDKIVLTIKPDNSLFGVESLEILDDEKKEQVKTNILSTLELDSYSYDGIKINIDINESIIISINVDLKIADKEILKKIGLDFSNADMSLKNAVNDMKKSGATCN